MHVTRLAALVLALVLAAGCARRNGPPAIAVGTACATCGMEANDLRFACERTDGRRWLVYDSIECLLADRERGGLTSAWLADYDRRSLHRADSLWVVRGEFLSPMGGGYAAFLSRGAADSVSAETRGYVDRLDAFGVTP